ncbi:MAG: apolipoprotein N-acyltransferase [Kiritimatiellae bacterium]|nr:apolipoprotein N-acyltransferase [Kiritimatiellia bacterium]
MEDEERSQNEQKNASRFTRDASQKIAAAFLSGILLFLSFPPFEFFPLAWLAPAPLIYICFVSKPAESFSCGLLAGAVFWLAGIFWLAKVSFFGWIFVALYCSLYFAVFAAIVSWWRGTFKIFNIQHSASDFERRDLCSKLSDSGGKVQRWMLEVFGVYMILLFGIPAVWVALEYVRTRILTGFPWNLLGVSQHACLPLIQCADWGGVYLVSYLIAMANAAVVLLVFNRGKGVLQAAGIIVPFVLIISLVLGYGLRRLEAGRAGGPVDKIRTASVQLNVPQQYKWSENWAEDIYRRLKKSAAAAGRPAPPGLIVWPETALPDFLRYGEASRAAANETLRHGVPLLAGSMDYEMLSGKTNYYNSSFLFIPGDEPPQVYIKRHLVICGEYVPLARFFPFLRSITGIEEDFTPGAETVVFRLKEKGRAFAVLICFEDIFPCLARAAVLAGARLLINQTNDAWFDPSWASRQHMVHCVFRCVENRVACLRAANTGVTCYIDRFGFIRSALKPAGAGVYEPQIMRCEAEFEAENMPLSFYTRHGDLFALACLAFTLPLLLAALLNAIGLRKKN